MESQHKSERVKAAVRKDDAGGITKSYKGKRWGRKPLPQNAIAEVHKLRAEGLSIRAIAKLVTYTDANNRPKRISPAAVHKILTESASAADSSKEAVHQSVN